MNGTELNSVSGKSQVKISFTDKAISVCGGVVSIIARYVEILGFCEWIEANLPIEEISPNGKGLYEKVLAIFLTVYYWCGEIFAYWLVATW